MNSDAKVEILNFLSGNISLQKHLAERNSLAYKNLITDFKQNNLIPFWGAGFTAGLFPTWSTLLERISTTWDVDLTLVEKRTEEEKTQYLVNEIGEALLLSELSAVFSKPEGELSPSRCRVREIFRSYHITTNYDQTIENLPACGMPSIKTFLPQQLQQNSELVSLIQQNKHCLIKLHGDISDCKMRENIILTKKSYDTYYPSSKPDTAVQQVLTAVLTSTPIVFIGCSLERDRTLQMVERYAKLGCRFYALLPLPESTANPDNPCRPLLSTGQGRMDYIARENFFAQRNITPIWYPCDKHEFVDGFLDLLYDEIVVCPQVKYEKIISLPKDVYVGRREQIDALYKTLQLGRIAWVSGGPGIGKSQLSYQVMARMQDEDFRRVYLTLDCQEISSLENLYLCCILTCNPNADRETVLKSSEILRDQALRVCQEAKNMSFFVDNFEMLNDAALEARFSLDMIDFFCELHDLGVGLLFASRYSDMLCSDRSSTLVRFRGKRDQFPVEALSTEDAHALFECHARGNLACQGVEFEQLLRLMEGHPMSITLVAGLCEEYTAWRYILQEFQEARETIITLSCRRSWALLRDNEFAKTIWGVLAWSTQPVPVSWVIGEGPTAPSASKELKQLVRLNLVSVKNDSITMLLPIKQEFNNMELAGVGERFDEKRIDWWVTNIGALVAKSFNPKMECHMSEILQIMSKLVDKSSVEAIAYLSEALRRYYALDLLASKKYLDTLLEFAEASREPRLRAAAYVGLGIYCHCRGLNDEASQLFENAGRFYSSVDERIYAYCLWHKGEVARMRAQYNEALELYEQAEQLFDREGDHHGLAQTLKSMGDVARMRARRDEAFSFFDRAQFLYTRLDDNQGLAQTLKSMADMARMRSQYNEALVLYERVQQLYAHEGDNLGLANTLSSMGYVARMRAQYDEAHELYERAQQLYIRVEDIPGLAQSLKSKGDIARRRAHYDEALSYYERAQTLYVQVEDNRGLANTLKSRGEIARMRNQLDDALALYEQARQLFIQVEDNLGLAYTLKSMGDVAHKRAQYDKALTLYEQAELLYVQMDDNRGLAYVMMENGEICRVRKQYRDALVFLDKAESIFLTIGDKNGESIVYKRKAIVYRGTLNLIKMCYYVIYSIKVRCKIG